MILDDADDSAIFDELAKGKIVTKAGKELNTTISLDNFLPYSRNGSILVTSRNKDLALRLTGDATKIIRIKSMNYRNALRLLRRKVKGQFNHEDAKELLEALGYLPLAIAQASALVNMHTPFLSISKFLVQFRQREAQLNLMNQDEGYHLGSDKASNPTLTTIAMSLERICQVKPSAAQMLSLMSVFDRHGIPKSLLYYTKDYSDPNYLTNFDIEFEDNIC